jgi:hypothetical protein
VHVKSASEGLHAPNAATFLVYQRLKRSSTGNPAMKWLLLLPIPLALAACEVGHIKLPMAPMTLGPADAPRTSCAGANETAAGDACGRLARPQAEH